jgi:glycogen debranching enzyme
VQCLFSGIASPERAHRVARMLLSPESFTGWGVRMVACAPQSWSAASVFLLFQACLGLEINGPEAQVYFTRPHLPISLGELRIHNL